MSFQILCEDTSNLIIGVGPFEDSNFGDGYTVHLVVDDDKYDDAVKDGAMWDAPNRSVTFGNTTN